MPESSTTEWHRFSEAARTDDWCELADALGIDYGGLRDDDLNSRQLRKVIQTWANEHGWDRVDDAIRKLRR